MSLADEAALWKLRCACEETSAGELSFFRVREICQRVLEKGGPRGGRAGLAATINAGYGAFGGSSAVHAAAEAGNLRVLRFLVKNGGDFDARTAEDGSCPAYYACAGGHAAVVKYLGKKGANMLQKNRFANTCFHVAALLDERECLKTLADVCSPVDLYKGLTEPGRGRKTCLQKARSEETRALIEELVAAAQPHLPPPDENTITPEQVPADDPVLEWLLRAAQAPEENARQVVAYLTNKGRNTLETVMNLSHDDEIDSGMLLIVRGRVRKAAERERVVAGGGGSAAAVENGHAPPGGEVLPHAGADSRPPNIVDGASTGTAEST